MRELHPIPDDTPEWYEARIGCWTASRIPELMSRTVKGGFTTKAMDYIIEIAIERITGDMSEHYVSRQMERGKRLEPATWTEYDFEKGIVTQPGGFIRHATIPNFGASPDRIIGQDKVGEGKAPLNRGKHLGSLMLARDRKAKHPAVARLADLAIAEEYYDQGQAHVMCTDRLICEFVSYAPQVGTADHLAIISVNRDEHRIGEIRAAIADAELAVTEMMGILRGKPQARAA